MKALYAIRGSTLLTILRTILSLSKDNTRYAVYLIGLSFVLSGCVVRTYPVIKDRVDQDLTGNRGYLKGEAPSEEARERKTTRTTQIVEIELYPPIKFEKAPKQKITETRTARTIEKTEDRELWGNRGYLTESRTPEIMEPEAIVADLRFEKYTVQKRDTLQKISKKFYGTTKKWNKIFQANRDALRSPDKIYPGQVINIPVESLKETKENLK